MTKDDIIRMAREVGYTSYDSQDERLQQLAALVAAHEREECAKICDTLGADEYCDMYGGLAFQCADMIRARGNK